MQLTVLGGAVEPRQQVAELHRDAGGASDLGAQGIAHAALHELREGDGPVGHGHRIGEPPFDDLEQLLFGDHHQVALLDDAGLLPGDTAEATNDRHEQAAVGGDQLGAGSLGGEVRPTHGTDHRLHGHVERGGKLVADLGGKVDEASGLDVLHLPRGLGGGQVATDADLEPTGDLERPGGALHGDGVVALFEPAGQRRGLQVERLAVDHHDRGERHDGTAADRRIERQRPRQADGGEQTLTVDDRRPSEFVTLSSGVGEDRSGHTRSIGTWAFATLTRLGGFERRTPPSG